MLRLRIGSLAALAALVLAGCGSTKLDEAPVENRMPASTNGAGNSGATPQSKVTTVDLAGGANAAGSKLGRVVYFDFDSYVVNDDSRSLVEGHAKLLAATRSKRLVIEGHTDERGGREYNLALGQKRAEAVAKSLTLLGATAAQLEAVSFGKERPVNEGHDEAAWAQNRRAELKDR